MRELGTYIYVRRGDRRWVFGACIRVFANCESWGREVWGLYGACVGYGVRQVLVRGRSGGVSWIVAHALLDRRGR